MNDHEQDQDQDKTVDQVLTERALQMSKIAGDIQDITKQVSPELADRLQIVLKNVLSLEYPPPALDHRELSVGELKKRGWAMVRMLINPAVESIHRTMHMSEILKHGEQWTMTLGSDCGFSGRVILQVDTLGKCADDSEDDERVKNPHANSEGAPPNDGTLPSMDAVNEYLKQMGLLPDQE